MYQYVTVKMPWMMPGSNKEQLWTERLNAVAAEGWRLIAINDEIVKGGVTGTFATFEREVSA